MPRSNKGRRPVLCHNATNNAIDIADPKNAGANVGNASKKLPDAFAAQPNKMQAEANKIVPELNIRFCIVVCLIALYFAPLDP